MLGVMFPDSEKNFTCSKPGGTAQSHGAKSTEHRKRSMLLSHASRKAHACIEAGQPVWRCGHVSDSDPHETRCLAEFQLGTGFFLCHSNMQSSSRAHSTPSSPRTPSSSYPHSTPSSPHATPSSPRGTRRHPRARGDPLSVSPPSFPPRHCHEIRKSLPVRSSLRLPTGFPLSWK